MANDPDELADPRAINATARSWTTLADRPPEVALDLLATIVDAAGDAGDVAAAQHADTLASTIDVTALDSQQRCLLNYYRGNAWAVAGRYATHGTSETWLWERLEVEREVFHLRAAMRGPGFAALPSIRRCQILTNAGNALSFVGRFVEAIELFNKALGIDAAFGHAQGNRAVCLDSYARSLYDDEHVALLLRTAHCDLTAALEVDIDPGARAMFAPLRDRIGGWLPPDFLRDGMDLESFSLGSSPSEVEYRTWCLREGLFLNPLNDLGPLPIAAHDVLTTPSVVTGLHEGPSVPGFFNQLKQEYCSARWIYFEATSRESSHFSDVGVLLYNTLDYPAYSLAVEQAKLAYRAAYSLFDKIAYFMNAYARLGIPEKRVTFRTLWYTAQERSKGIRADLAARENWPWRGLHWLSKDLFEDRPEFRDVMDPDSRGLAELRNHLEHKYLKLHDDFWPGSDASTTLDPLRDTLAFSVRRDAFMDATRRVLKLARAAMIYLSLGVRQEEQGRAKTRPDGHKIMPIHLGVWEDRWKR
jgi:tetratricopeptide (TPR) repeat protein